MACALLKTRYPNNGLSVYIDNRFLIQIRDGTVCAFQTRGMREINLINTILKEEGLSEKYTMTPDGLVDYSKGDIKVWKLSDCLLMNKQ